MPGSTASLFPDINVWVALTYEGHAHHQTAATWFAALKPEATLAFCRFTQLGLLRLLTSEAVMGDEVMTQPQAWAAYGRWHHDSCVEFVDEPAELEARFRALTRLRRPATKDWADSTSPHSRPSGSSRWSRSRLNNRFVASIQHDDIAETLRLGFRKC